MEKQHTALAVYQQGIGLVTRANAEHPGLRALQDQEIITRKLITQVDPLEVLPAEILVLILGYLNTRHHCRCVKLSKSWKAFMESQVARPLWLYQHFDQVAKTVSKTIKPNMVQRHLAKFAGGQLKSLRVDNCAMIPLVCTKFTSVLRACPHLRRLSLGGHATINLGGHVFDKTLFSKMPRLEFLHLDPHINIPPETLDCLINSSCGTLRELNILKLPYDPLSPAITYPKDWWQLPKLHTLRYV